MSGYDEKSTTFLFSHGRALTSAAGRMMKNGRLMTMNEYERRRRDGTLARDQADSDTVAICMAVGKLQNRSMRLLPGQEQLWPTYRVDTVRRRIPDDRSQPLRDKPSPRRRTHQRATNTVVTIQKKRPEARFRSEIPTQLEFKAILDLWKEKPRVTHLQLEADLAPGAVHPSGAPSGAAALAWSLEHLQEDVEQQLSRRSTVRREVAEAKIRAKASYYAHLWPHVRRHVMARLSEAGATCKPHPPSL